MTEQDQPVDGLAGERRPAPGAMPGPGGLREHADALRAGRTPFVQATVVRAIRPTSAKAGDRALILPDGTIEGFVGGTCAESSVRLEGLRVLRGGDPVVLRIIPEAPPLEESGAGGPPPPEPLPQGEPSAAGAGPGSAGPAGAAAEGLVTVHNPCASGGMLEIFLEGVFPPPLVQVCGDAPIARALATVGAALGYDVVAAGSGEHVVADATAVVVASHGRDEETVLAEALRAGIPYVGLVASRRRGAAVVASLEVPAGDRGRLHTPAGLDIGGRTPEEVALSIFAEIVAERRRAAPAVPHGSSSGREPAGAAREAEPAGAGRDHAGHERDHAGHERDHAGHERDHAGHQAGHERDHAPAPAVVGEAIDPVCGMTVAMSQATPQLTHDGQMWYFCGPGCRQAFADDPGRYRA